MEISRMWWRWRILMQTICEYLGEIALTSEWICKDFGWNCCLKPRCWEHSRWPYQWLEKYVTKPTLYFVSGLGDVVQSLRRKQPIQFDTFLLLKEFNSLSEKIGLQFKSSFSKEGKIIFQRRTSPRATLRPQCKLHRQRVRCRSKAQLADRSPEFIERFG
jgi:hypothetical protein